MINDTSPPPLPAAATETLSKLDEAIAFYKRKTADNKKAVKRYAVVSLFFAWIGGGLLALSAYDLLRPLYAAVGLGAEDHILNFIYATPQSIPTLLVAAAAAIGEFLRRRGYIKAQARYGLALSRLELLRATFSVELKASQDDKVKNDYALAAMTQFKEIAGEERAAWASDLVKDFSAVTRPKISQD